MKLAKRFFKKYLLSTLIILILFFVLNIILICGTLLMAWNNSTDPDIPVQTISKNITLNVDGTISSTDYIENILKNKSAWAMILNEQGNVIWEKFLPEELPRTYSNLVGGTYKNILFLSKNILPAYWLSGANLIV